MISKSTQDEWTQYAKENYGMYKPMDHLSLIPTHMYTCTNGPSHSHSDTQVLEENLSKCRWVRLGLTMDDGCIVDVQVEC